ncbi:MAG TPA: LysE family translocator [Bryobacteraceae bacterium]|nr:LysE family translocator [Bryobacteraceae bacterium]
MLDITAVLAFAAAAGLLTVTPGLDTALVLRTGAVEGPGEARSAAFGICGGCLVWGTATSLGLTALLTLSKIAYDVVRLTGACYLIYLGIRMCARKRTFNIETETPVEHSARHQSSKRRWLVRGLLTNVLNPKVGIFYITLLPQFIPPGGSIMTYSLLFAFIHVAEGLLWLNLLTLAMQPLQSWLHRPAVTRGLDCGTGTVLIGAGVALAFERRR